MAVNDMTRVRADEKSRKAGITFGDLCELVDRARERGVDPGALVTGDTWIWGQTDGKDGYRLRFVEV